MSAECYSSNCPAQHSPVTGVCWGCVHCGWMLLCVFQARVLQAEQLISLADWPAYVGVHCRNVQLLLMDFMPKQMLLEVTFVVPSSLRWPCHYSCGRKKPTVTPCMKLGFRLAMHMRLAIYVHLVMHMQPSTACMPPCATLTHSGSRALTRCHSTVLVKYPALCCQLY